MKIETEIIYTKYSKKFNIIHIDRHTLFFYIKEHRCDPDKDFKKYFETREFIIEYHKQIKSIYYTFKTSRNNLLKNFEKEKRKIQYNDYEKVLKKYFCYDVKNIILEFLININHKCIYLNAIK